MSHKTKISQERTAYVWVAWVVVIKIMMMIVKKQAFEMFKDVKTI